VGKKIDLSNAFGIGYFRAHRYGIEVLRGAKGGLSPVKERDRKREFQLHWNHNETAREELLALLDYLEGKNMALIPDNSTLTDCYLVKLIGDVEQMQTDGDNFDVGPLVFEEVL